MKKTSILIIISCFVILLTGIVFAYKTRLLNVPLGNVVVKNDKYGFEFSYSKNKNLHVTDEWDNGLPGSSDGGVYGYRAEGDYGGPFTDRISVSIYNTSLEKYLSKYQIEKFSWELKDVNKYGRAGKMLTDAKSTGLEAASDANLCELLFENRGLLYIVDCNITYFKFYK